MSELWLGFVPGATGDLDRIAAAAERSWYEPAAVSDQELARLRARLAALEQRTR